MKGLAYALSLLLAAAAGCADEDARESTAPVLDQQLGGVQATPMLDAGALLPPSIDAGILPTCRTALKELRYVFGYPLPVHLTAAAASREGYVVIAYDGLDVPQLKLVHTPEAHANANLHTLLPESLRKVLALSEIRGDQLLVAHGPDAEGVTMISALDLRRHVVQWSRPLRDPSGLPRPKYDHAGQVVGAWQGADLRRTSVQQLLLREDGRYDVLASIEGSLYLLGYQADGSTHYRTLVHPLPRNPRASLTTRGDGSMSLALHLQSDERRAFMKAHDQYNWPDARNRHVVMLLHLTPSGRVERFFEADVDASDQRLVGTLTAPQDRPTYFLSDVRSPRQLLVSLSPQDQRAPAVVTPFRTREDGISSTAVVGENLYVAGLLDQRFGFKGALQGGTPFMGRVGRDGTLRWGCAEAKPVVADPRVAPPLFELTLWPTQAPLVVVRSPPDPTGVAFGDPSLVHQMRVYLMQEPSDS